MSYTLQIWQPAADQPLPSDLAGAEAAVDRLEGQQPGPNPLFQELVQRLTRQFPDITSAEAAELPEWELAWTDGPIRGGGTDAIFVLGLHTQRLDEVRPVVVAKANALGLAVFDTQAAEAFFPGGVHFAAGTPAGPRATDRVQVSRAREGAAAVVERVAPLFEARGFKTRKSSFSFKRSLDGGWQIVSLLVENHRPAVFQFSLHATVRFEAVASLCGELLAPFGYQDDKTLPTVVLRQREWMQAHAPFTEPPRRDYVVTDPGAMAGMLAHLESQCANVLLPILDAARTIEGLDHALNTEPREASPFFKGYEATHVPIAVAYFARNPGLRELSEHLIEKTFVKVDKQMARVCADYALGHPLPEKARL